MGAEERREELRDYILDTMFNEDKYSLTTVLSYCPVQIFYLILSFFIILGNYLSLHFYRSCSFYCMLF